MIISEKGIFQKDQNDGATQYDDVIQNYNGRFLLQNFSTELFYKAAFSASVQTIMALKAVANAIPDWLKLEWFKLHTHVKKDLEMIKREVELLKDVALIDYHSLREIIGNLNMILQSCTTNNNVQRVMFAIDLREEEDGVFWKTFVRILCLKVDMQDRTARVTRKLNLRQFWRLRMQLLTEIHYKNLLECKYEGFQLVDHNGDTEGEEFFDEQPDVPVAMPMTVSTVLERVDEVSGSSTDDSECLICMDNMIQVSLPCAHSFCSKCITQWYDENQTCPICRDELDKPEDYWEFTGIPDIAEINEGVLKLASGT